jgi:hypothetical protein
MCHSSGAYARLGESKRSILSSSHSAICSTRADHPDAIVETDPTTPDFLVFKAANSTTRRARKAWASKAQANNGVLPRPLPTTRAGCAHRCGVAPPVRTFQDANLIWPSPPSRDCRSPAAVEVLLLSEGGGCFLGSPVPPAALLPRAPRWSALLAH